MDSLDSVLAKPLAEKSKHYGFNFKEDKVIDQSDIQMSPTLSDFKWTQIDRKISSESK